MWWSSRSILPLLLLVGAAAIPGERRGESELATVSASHHQRKRRARCSIGSIVAALAFLLLAIPLAYIFKAAQARTERVLGGLLFLSSSARSCYAAQGVLLAIGQIDVADQFVSQEAGVGDIYSLSQRTSPRTRARSSAALICAIQSAIARDDLRDDLRASGAVRTGLLTRFHGTLGMALGASFILPPLIGLTLPALLAWFMYFGLLLAGRTPRGRPPAWDAGVAVPPPGRGEEPEPVAAGAGGGDIVEGDAMEIPGVDENPNAARRERAKKRKRKRRR